MTKFKKNFVLINRWSNVSIAPTKLPTELPMVLIIMKVANYDLALWVAYYNFLRPHKHNHYQVLNKADMLNGADNMPGKWQLLIFLGQQTILNLQTESSNCS